MGKKIAMFFLVMFIIGFIYYKLNSKDTLPKNVLQKINQAVTVKNLNPLTIESMRAKSYPGSDLVIEQTLSPEPNYNRYIASYKSDGLKIYGLLTIPQGTKPKSGWPVIIFNHGYINPSTYQVYPTVGQYASYYPYFSRSGYIVFKPDFRGNGNSEGQPEGAYYSPAYATDDLNALTSIKKYKDADPNKIGMWGHSMGGNITLRSLVVDPKDIKAAVIWGGVVGSYTDLLNWHDPSYHPSAYELSLRNRYRATLQKQYGTPESNPDFWNSIDPTHFLSDITAPIQLHHGESDEEVPLNFATELKDKLQSAGKTVELFTYTDDNHNISNNLDIAMQRSLEFFDKYLK
jgi:dipeptidyl aminopeptidase/acylaminoacyl peptidase